MFSILKIELLGTSNSDPVTFSCILAGLLSTTEHKTHFLSFFILIRFYLYF